MDHFHRSMSSANTDQNGNGVTPSVFQDMLKERKAERKARAEEKRQSDARRIEEMNSKTGAEPLELFPKELWEVILDELPPVDKGSISKVHDLFHTLIPESTRIRDILFPPVFEVSSSKDSPLASSYKLLRGVSQSLRKAVDKYHDERLLRLIRSETKVMAKGIDLSQSSLSMFPPNIIEKYFSGEEKNKPKFCFTRSLHIRLPTTQAQVDWRKPELVKMLEQIGNQIWCLRFCWYDDIFPQGPVMSVSEIYREFNSFLQFMPNLKWLKLDLWMNPLDEDQPIGKIPKDQIKSTPKMQFLERVDCHSISDNEEAIEFYEAFLKANSHIKTLGLRGQKDSMIANRLVKSLLSLEAFVPLIFPDGTFKLIKDMINYNWQLKRIHLDLDEAGLTVCSIFQFLEKFPTLEYVNLAMRVDHLSLAGELSYLRLPNLVRLEMVVLPHDEECFKREDSKKGAQFFFSLQFLLYSAKLKSLKWQDVSANPRKLRGYMERESNSERNIDFCGGWRNLSDSNIWDVFPELENVKVISMHEEKAGKFVAREYCKRSLVSATILSSRRSVLLS